MIGAAPDNLPEQQLVPREQTRARRIGLRVPNDQRMGAKLAMDKLDRERVKKVFVDAGVTEYGEPSKKPTTLTLTDGEIRALDAEIEHLEQLVAPYQSTENIVRYLRSLESALVAQQNIRFNHRVLSLDISELTAAKPYQARLAKIDEALNARKNEIFNTPSIFEGKAITTYDSFGKAHTRSIDKITWDNISNKITIEFYNGHTDTLQTMINAQTKPTVYGPEGDDRTSVEGYIHNCFGDMASVIQEIKNNVIYLKTASGKKWSIHFRYETNPQDAFRTPALMISKISNWQVLFGDPYLSAYKNERLTQAKVSGLLGYIELHDKPYKTESRLDRAQQWADSLWEKGTRRLHGIGSWFTGLFS